jgi:threonine synthase
VVGELLGAMSHPADQRTRSCATELVCPDCGYRTPLMDTAFRCPHCDKGLDVVYDYELARERIAELGPEMRPLNIWRYEELLPIRELFASENVGVFSGLTPLIRADRLGAELGLSNLYLKDD